jgi:hypothetical protein
LQAEPYAAPPLTRREAMTIIQRAAKIAGITGSALVLSPRSPAQAKLIRVSSRRRKTRIYFILLNQELLLGMYCIIAEATPLMGMDWR